MTWLDDFVEYAQGLLDDRVREALWTRGATNTQIAAYRVGYFDAELPPLDYPEGFLKWSRDVGLDDVFVLPLTNALGEIKGLQFRHVMRERTGYSDYLPPCEEPVYFGLAQAMPSIWKTCEVCLVEGVFDLFPIQRVFPGTIATLTARVTGDLARFLYRFADRIWVCYDRDPAGFDGCKRFLQSQYSKPFRARILRLPKVPKFGGKGWVKDPSELWEVWGDDRLGVYLRQQRDS